MSAPSIPCLTHSYTTSIKTDTEYHHHLLLGVFRNTSPIPKPNSDVPVTPNFTPLGPFPVSSVYLVTSLFSFFIIDHFIL